MKIVLMGPGAVGKTSIRKRYLGLGFKSDHYMTIGADFAIKKLSIDGTEYLIQIWDLSGQPLFYEVRRLYYKNSSGLFLVFDLSNLETLDAIPSWISEYHKNSIDHNVPAVLIGNKVDLITDLEATKQQIKRKIVDLNLEHDFESEIIMTSALNGENIDQAFEIIIKAIIARA